MRLFRIWVIAMLMLSMVALAGCGGDTTPPEEPATEEPAMEEPATEEMPADTGGAMEEMPADTGAAAEEAAGGE